MRHSAVADHSGASPVCGLRSPQVVLLVCLPPPASTRRLTPRPRTSWAGLPTAARRSRHIPRLNAMSHSPDVQREPCPDRIVDGGSSTCQLVQPALPFHSECVWLLLLTPVVPDRLLARHCRCGGVFCNGSNRRFHLAWCAGCAERPEGTPMAPCEGSHSCSCAGTWRYDVYAADRCCRRAMH